MTAYLTRHLQVLFSTLGTMRRTPGTSLATILVIGISLLLPALMYVTLKSGEQLTQNWQGQPQFSVFLQTNTATDEAQLIFDELRLHPAIEIAEFVTPNEALAEFKSLSGMDFELDFLDQNPLPASIVALPNSGYRDSNALLALRDELAKIEGIDDIRLDLEWTDRFNAILQSLNASALALSVLLGIGIALIVGNTIKLLILNRRQEIEISKLVGGSNRFVRRPFLYFGALFGFFGSVVCIALLLGISHYLHQPLSHLASLYQQESLIYQPKWREFGLLLALGTLLGLFSARLSVAQHLSKIRPK